MYSEELFLETSSCILYGRELLLRLNDVSFRSLLFDSTIFDPIVPFTSVVVPLRMSCSIPSSRCMICFCDRCFPNNAANKVMKKIANIAGSGSSIMTEVGTLMRTMVTNNTIEILWLRRSLTSAAVTISSTFLLCLQCTAVPPLAKSLHLPYVTYCLARHNFVSQCRKEQNILQIILFRISLFIEFPVKRGGFVFVFCVSVRTRANNSFNCVTTNFSTVHMSQVPCDLNT